MISTLLLLGRACVRTLSGGGVQGACGIIHSAAALSIFVMYTQRWWNWLWVEMSYGSVTKLRPSVEVDCVNCSRLGACCTSCVALIMQEHTFSSLTKVFFLFKCLRVGFTPARTYLSWRQAGRSQISIWDRQQGLRHQQVVVEKQTTDQALFFSWFLDVWWWPLLVKDAPAWDSSAVATVPLKLTVRLRISRMV